MQISIKRICVDESGDAVVEAAILFPIIIMIFFAFILLAIYLPTSAALQRSLEKAANIVSARHSDLGYTYDVSNDKAGVSDDRLRQENVYAYMTRGYAEEQEIAQRIVEKYVTDALYVGKDLHMSVRQDPNDKRYILISAEQTLVLPFDFPFLPVSNEIPLKRSVRVMSRDADEFIRSMDIVYDLVIKKAKAVKETMGDISNFMNVFNKVKSLFRI